MRTTADHARHQWRLSLQPERQKAVDKALWHHRIDLWYGSHHLRFTRAHAGGHLLLRLEERASFVGDGPVRTLVSLEASDEPLLYEESHWLVDDPVTGETPRADRGPTQRGRDFSARAARFIDAREEPAGRALAARAVRGRSASASP